ncbi:MAG: hypothetical protein Q9215_000229 [Flavoplaca cf. flavocitrina]
MVMVQLVAILPQGTSIRDKPEKNHRAPVDTDKGACLHPMADDMAMWTETVKDIDRLYMTVGAEAEVEAPHDEIARLTSGPRPAERLFWKEFRWTCKRKTFAITSPSVSKQLKQGYGVEQLDDVRVIRDRQTKLSRGFGFLKFPSIDLSKAFLERNFPSIYLYGRDSADNDSQAAKVRIDFSRERDERPRGDKEGEWTLHFYQLPWKNEVLQVPITTNWYDPYPRVVFEYPNITPDMSTFGNASAVKQPPSMNSGDSDASPNGTPSQFLLLRGLEPTVSEDLLAKGVSKLYKPSRRSSPPTASSSKKGISKVASTTGDANLGAKEGSLRRVLLVRDRKSNESWRYGFAEFATVEEAQAAFVRFNSFDKFTISSKPVTVNYVHAGVFVPVFSASDPDEFCFNPLGNTATKLAYWDKEAYVSLLAVSSGPADLSTGAADSQVKSSADIAAAAAEGEGLLQSGKENEVKAKKRKAEATNAAAKLKKTAPAHLQFWSNRHAELHGIKSGPSQDQNTDDPKSKKGSSGAAAEDNSTPTETFANPEKKCCYLCSRQFKAEAEVNKHERLSQLHRDNLTNDQLVAQARAKMAKAGLSTTVTTQGDGSEYRDRAKERRAAFGGSKKISLPLKKQASQPEHTESNVSDQPPPPSKGASLLGKMGWSAGEGLGAQGTGRTEAIATEMYVQGVGLGAQGGKIGDAVDEAGRNTVGGYAGFAERTRDKAKERFEKMG